MTGARARFLRWSVVVALVATTLSVVTTNALASPHLPDFKNPTAMAFDARGHLWVANQDKFGITEVDIATGIVMRLVDAKADDFLDPSGVAVDGTHVWVVNAGFSYPNGTDPTGRIDELDDATGALIKVINLNDRHVTGLQAVSASGDFVWVVAAGGDQVVKLSNETGKVVHIFRTGRQRISNYPSNILSDSSHVWIPNSGGTNAILERSADSGAQLRSLKSTLWEKVPGLYHKEKLSLMPDLLTKSGNNLWSANAQGLSFGANRDSASEFRASTGTLIRTVGSYNYRFSFPQAICSDALDVWILNGEVGTRHGQIGNTVTELNSSTGALVRVIHFSSTKLKYPMGVATNGAYLFVSGQNATGVSGVLELNVATGTVVRSIY